MVTNRAKANAAAKLLLNLLQFDSTLAPTGVERCLRYGHDMDEHAKARAAALIQHRVFKSYMTEDASSASLLVNGNEDVSNAEGVSPLSVVGAKLARISEQTKSTFVLRYFCREHGPYSNDSATSSPSFMLASLAGQLIDQLLHEDIPIDLSFLQQVRFENVKKLKPATLDVIFRELVIQVPAGSVLLCIIDEPSVYETRLLKGDTQAIFRRLVRLVKNIKHIAFKLFVTCRGRARDINQYFIGHVLELSETVEEQDSSAWYIENLERQIEQGR